MPASTTTAVASSLKPVGLVAGCHVYCNGSEHFYRPSAYGLGELLQCCQRGHLRVVGHQHGAGCRASCHGGRQPAGHDQHSQLARGALEIPWAQTTSSRCFNSKHGLIPISTPIPNFVSSNGTVAQTVNPAPIATLVPPSLSFGNQQGGTTSGAQIATLCNGPSGAMNTPCFSRAQSPRQPLAINSIAFGGTKPHLFHAGETPAPRRWRLEAVASSNVKFAPPVKASGVANLLCSNVTDNSGPRRREPRRSPLLSLALESAPSTAFGSLLYLCTIRDREWLQQLQT